MAVRDSELQTHGPWPGGIDNTSKEAKLRPGTVRGAENVDFDNDGVPNRRQGYVQLEALPGLHSLWAHPLYPFMLGATPTQLQSWDAGLERVALVALTAPREPLSFGFAGGRVYWSNGVDSGLLLADGTPRAWCTETPRSAPLLAVNTGAGGLEPGTYQVSQTFIDDLGRESACPLPSTITVANGEGIDLSAIAQPTDPDVAYVRIYASRANGAFVEAVADLPVGVTTFALGVGARGRTCDTVGLDPMPAGHLVRMGGLRQFVATGRMVRWSPAGYPGLTRTAKAYTLYDEAPVLLEQAGQATGAGWYVATSKRTWYMAGPDPAEWNKAIAYGHGAIAGSAGVAEGKDLGVGAQGPVPYWMATNGVLVAGLPSGQVVPVTAPHYRADGAGATRGASALRTDGNGLNHVIMLLRNARTSGDRLGATDEVSAEIVRNGIVVG